MYRLHRYLGVVLAVLLSVASMRGQAARPLQPNNAALIKRIENAYITKMLRDLNLGPDQVPKFRQILVAHSDQRLQLEREGRKLHNNLDNLLAAGAQPKPARVNALLDAISANEMAYEATFGDEMRALAPVLTPMQRGMYQRGREVFQQQVRKVQMSGAKSPPAVPPAARGQRAGGGGKPR